MVKVAVFNNGKQITRTQIRNNYLRHCYTNRMKYYGVFATVYLTEIYTYSQFVRGMHT